MTKYVLGFLFNLEDKDVVLIEKLRPEWQRGKYNGVGGKIENNEASFEAMIREFKEETGFLFEDWKFFSTMHDENWNVDVYCGRTYKNLFHNIIQTETERPIVFQYNHNLFNKKLLPNLKWLIPMALATINGEEEITARVEYFGHE